MSRSTPRPSARLPVPRQESSSVEHVDEEEDHYTPLRRTRVNRRTLKVADQAEKDDYFSLGSTANGIGGDETDRPSIEPSDLESFKPPAIPPIKKKKPILSGIDALMNITGMRRNAALGQHTGSTNGVVGNGPRIKDNVENLDSRRRFLLTTAKALLTFGAPSHRIEGMLTGAADILDAEAEFVHIPGLIIMTLHPNSRERASMTYYVRGKGKIALSSLRKVHDMYRRVTRDELPCSVGIQALQGLLRAEPIYHLYFRCFLAFLLGALICAVSFGGSLVDMWIAGLCSGTLQYLGLNAANKSSLYGNVYEITGSFVVAFVARGLSNVPGDWFCYNAISGAGVSVILPGFTVLTSALELMSRNIFCGSVRIVYAVIYTLFLGFGLTIGSDTFLQIDKVAARTYYVNPAMRNLTYAHGHFTMINGSAPFVPIPGVLGYASKTYEQLHAVQGCFRDPDWPWYKLNFQWQTLFLLVPLYTLCSSLSNLQSWKSWRLPVMVIFACFSFTATRAAALAFPNRADITSAAGALTIGILGNVYSRIRGGTAFTAMVTGVLFLVPSGIAQSGGIGQKFNNAAEQYSTGFQLALRMISVASGVTIGLLLSQIVVYISGRKKTTTQFAF